MKYVSPRFEKVEIEGVDILMASGEGEVEINKTSENTADLIINVNNLFGKINL